jgi:RNA polymerase sigma-70 factor, ECF subfamily
VSLTPGEDERDDRELLAAHVAGDDRAFGLLFARHRDRLWAVALRTTGDPEEAADALQDAMVSAFRRAAGFRGDSAVTTWLHRVVVNACLDRLRRRQVRLAEPLPDDLDTDSRTAGSLDPGSGAAADDPAEVAVRTDRGRLVRAALATLPVEQRAALVLVDMEGYSVEETAAILAVAPGTVKSRCSRGRARLLPLVAGLLGEPTAEGPRPTGERSSGAEPVGSPSADEGGEQP